MRVCVVLPYEKITGAAHPVLVFVKELSYHADTVILIKGGGGVERYCLERDIPYLAFSLTSLFKAVLFSNCVFTVRSKETFWAFLFSFILGGRKVFRLDFHNRPNFWDRFVVKVGVSKLGWVDYDMVGKGKKSRNFNVCVVSRLKPERKVGEVLEDLFPPRVRFRLFITGKGEELLSLKEKFKNCGVLFISKKLPRFFDFLSAMDILLYPQSGTDKSARSVLEAMINRVVVVTKDLYALKYIRHKKTGVVVERWQLLHKLFFLPSLISKIRLNAFRKAEGFFIEKRINFFLKMIED